MTRRRLIIANPPAGLRERTRADGTTRIWWEPSPAARQLGFAPVDLDENRPTWSRRQAERLLADVARAQRTGRRDTPRASSRTVDALIADYQRSLAYLEGLRPKTRASYAAHFRLIAEKWGPHQVRDFTKPVMRTWYETLFRTKSAHMAAAQLRAMSILLGHAEMIGWRAEGSNPCYRLRMVTPAPRARAATWAEVDAITTTADRIGLPSIGTAALLSLLQGQRQTDIILARAGDFTTRITRDGSDRRARIQWTFTRSKRGNAAALWLHDEVAPRIAPLLTGATPDRRLLHDEETGKPYTEDSFARRWAKVRAAAIEAESAAGRPTTLADLQFRDLRRTFGVLSRRGGSTRDDTADVLGNSAATNPRLAETYMPAQLDTASRAVDAIRRPAGATKKGG